MYVIKCIYRNGIDSGYYVVDRGGYWDLVGLYKEASVMNRFTVLLTISQIKRWYGKNSISGLDLRIEEKV